MGKNPAFQLYVRDWLSDEAVALMTFEEQGVYLNLLCRQWLEGSIPADLDQLARLLGTTRARMRRWWGAVGPKFQPSDIEGRLVNARLEEQRQERAAWVEKSRQGGLRSARGRAERAKGGSTTLQPPSEPNGNTASASASASKQITDDGAAVSGSVNRYTATDRAAINACITELWQSKEAPQEFADAKGPWTIDRELSVLAALVRETPLDDVLGAARMMHGVRPGPGPRSLKMLHAMNNRSFFHECLSEHRKNDGRDRVAAGDRVGTWLDHNQEN